MNQVVSRWYREPFVWLIVGLLTVTVVLCFGLLIVAHETDDGLVVDDYYKRGNEVSKDIARDQQAAKLGLSATVLLSDDGKKLRVLLIPMPTTPTPLSLTLAHPTLAGEDQTIALSMGKDGMLLGQLTKPLAPHRWLVQLADAKAGWRLRAESQIAAGTAIDLKPMALRTEPAAN